ncbi:MAG: hypothetical protein ACOH16_10045 [Propionibacteriaceae bacterium]
MTVRRMLLALLTSLAAVGLWLNAPPALALPAPQAASCAGVWVVVDYGSLGGTSTGCATSFSTGTAALRGAGFGPTLDNGMVTKINGIPATVNVQDHYWSYWHATLQADGSYSSWTYSGLGSNAYHPTAGNADGWRYQALSDGYVAPGVAPPKRVAAAPATTAPAPTTAKPATTKPVATAPPTAQATQSAPDQTASLATPTPEASVSDAPSAVATASDVAEPAPSPSASTTPASAKASLLGGIVVIVVLVVASIGLAVWRKRRGRVG